METQKKADERELLRQILHSQQKLEARAQIENLMGRYAQLHSAGRDREILDTLWSSREDSTFEDRFSGVYPMRGRLSGLRDYYAKAYGMSADAQVRATPEPGRMYIDAMTSPVIEIADDLQTAKGSWITTGSESRPNSGHSEKGGAYKAFWVWARIGADFVMENGAWRIWHLHIFDLLRCPFEKNWIDYAHERIEEQPMEDTRMRTENPFLLPSYPTRDFWQYSPQGGMPETVLIPEPYDTFQNTFHY